MKLSVSTAFSNLHRRKSVRIQENSKIIEEWDEDLNSIRYKLLNSINITDTSIRSSFNYKSLGRFMLQTFIPSGYPDSVPMEYLNFQKWNLLQDFCSYLRGIMMTKALLAGIGVGRADITATEATIMWILRDGASFIGGLIFTAMNSYNFGQNIKVWRLFADSINNVGITLNMIAPLFPQYFLPFICLGSLCTALCGIAAGATGAAINAHWGSKGNIAEVLAKNGAQHTAVSLVGLALSVPFTRWAENIRPLYTWLIYGSLTAIHMLSNYRAMRILALTSLNISRYHVLLGTIFSTTSAADFSKMTEKEAIIFIEQCMKQLNDHAYLQKFTPHAVAAREPILSLFIPTFLQSRKSIVSRVRHWASISSHMRQHLTVDTDGLLSELSQHTSVFLPIESHSPQQSFDLCFSHGISFHGQARAYFTAYLLDQFANLSLHQAQTLTQEHFPKFWEVLQKNGWQVAVSSLRPAGAVTYQISPSSAP